jgi:hypothetical protein
MVGGWVTKPKTTNKGKTMIRPKRNDEPIQLTKQDLMKLLTGQNKGVWPCFVSQR